MKWLKRLLRNWIEDDEFDTPEVASRPKRRNQLVAASNSYEADGGLTMRLYKAHGGRIVSFNHYDHKTDRSNNSVYIITDEQDFERELAKMITMESMRS